MSEAESVTSADVLSQWIWDDILSVVQRIYNTLVGSISNALGSIKRAVDGIVGAVANQLTAWGNTLLSTMYNVRDRVIQSLNSVIASAQSWIETVVNTITIRLQGVANTLLTPLNTLWQKLQAGLEWIRDRITALGTTVYNAIQTGMSSLGGFLAQLSRDIGSFLAGAAQTIGNVLASLSRDIGAKLADLSRHIGEALATAAQRIGDWLAGAANTIRDVISTAWSRITQTMAAVGSGIQQTITSVIEGVRNVLNTIMTRIAETLERLIRTLEKMIQDVVNMINTQFFAPLQRDMGEGASIMQLKARAIIRLALGGYRDHRDFLRDLEDPPPLIGALGAMLAGVVVMVVLAPAVSHALEPAFAHITNTVRSIVGGTLLSPTQAVEAYLRGYVPAGFATEELARWGLDKERIQALIELGRPLLSPGMIQTGYLRGLISEAEHDKLLKQHGYTEDQIRLFKRMYWVIPNIPDLIRMAVREAFSPEVAQRFGQYEDYPAEVSRWARMLGLDEEWAKRYWAAHWDLPSAQMGFQMLHRGIIDENELKLLLRALDVMPYWRERLIKLSYNPYTRVDVRRMYQMGVLNERDVYRSYRDLGYDDEKARRLTEFTIRYYSTEDEDELEETRQLTRSVYINAYVRGLLTRQEAAERLRDLHYADADIRLLLALADLQRNMQATEDNPGTLVTRFANLTLDAYRRGVLSEDETRRILADIGKTKSEVSWYIALGRYERTLNLHIRQLNIIREQFTGRIISRAEAQAKLAKIGCSPGEINQLMDEWSFERDERTRHPTEAQLRAAWAAGIITRDQYAEELRGLGYAERYVQMLVALAESRLGGA